MPFFLEVGAVKTLNRKPCKFNTGLKNTLASCCGFFNLLALDVHAVLTGVGFAIPSLDHQTLPLHKNTIYIYTCIYIYTRIYIYTYILYLYINIHLHDYYLRMCICHFYDLASIIVALVIKGLKICIISGRAFLGHAGCCPRPAKGYRSTS